MASRRISLMTDESSPALGNWIPIQKDSDTVNYRSTVQSILNTAGSTQYATIASLASYLPLAGGTMSGAIDMGGNEITEFDFLAHTDQNAALTVGKIRLSNNDAIAWDDNAATGQLRLVVDTSDTFVFKDAATTALLSIGSTESRFDQVTGVDTKVIIDTSGGNMDSILSFYENNVDRASIYWDGSGNDLYITSTTGDLFIEPAAGDVRLGVGTDLWIRPTQRFYLDNGSDTSIRESSSNVTAFETGGVDSVYISDARIEVYNADGGTVIQGNNDKTTATGLTLLQIKALGKTTTADDYVYGQLLFKNPDNTNTSEDGSLTIQMSRAGTLESFMGFNNSSDNEIEFYKITDYVGTMGSSTVDPSTHGAPDDWVEIKIGGTTYYVPAYLAT